MVPMYPWRVASVVSLEREESSHWPSYPMSTRHISDLTSFGKHKAGSESGKPPTSPVQSIIEQQEDSTEVNSLLLLTSQSSESVTKYYIS